jgi:acetate---CoA ligase (ADP-forming)
MTEPGGPPIEALIRPRSIAIVGASPRSYVGRVLCENLRGLGYEGQVFPVNPRYEEVAGWPCYPSVDGLPERPDAVVAAVPLRSVPDVLRAAGALGTRAAVVPGGGFTETGPQALEIQNEIAAVAAEFGMEVCGPNCMGVIAPVARSAMYIGTLAPSLLPGRVALISQSGSVVEAAVNMGPRVGFSALISCGNEAVTTIGRYLQYLAHDNATGAVTLFIEGFRDPAGFVEGARALRDAGKPLAVLKAGRSREAVAAIAAHSGSLAGTDEVVSGLLHQLGAIGVDDLDELFEVAEVLAHGRMPKGRRVFVVTDSGGEANLVADHIRRAGLEAPPPSDALIRRLQARWPNFSYLGNPIDPWGVDPDYGPLYSEILLAAAEEEVDVLAVALDKVTPWAGENEVDLGVAGANALIAATRGTDKLPVFFTVHATGPAAEVVRERLRAAGTPLLHGLRPAMVALRQTWWWQQWPPRSAPSGPGVGEVGPARQALDPGEDGPILSERASRAILAAFGVPLVRCETAATAEKAADAAERMGFPAVAKADVSGMAHKAAAGLVATSIVSPGAAAAAFDMLTERAASHGLRARGVLIQATASGVELICGMRRDPLFGPVVLIGVGGTLTEVLRQVAVRACPVAPEDLREMVEECPAGALLAAVGAPPHPVLEVLAALSHLALEHPEIEEVDVNPLFAGPDGVVAADALVVLSTGHPGSTVA